jgi:sugar lactone lactonase YvrE
MKPGRVVPVLVVTFALALLGCSGSSNAGPDAGSTPDGGPDSGTIVPDAGPTTGSLTVTVTGATAPGNVTVTGPNGYSQALTATTTLSNLAPGSYSISAAQLRLSGALVDTLQAGVAAPATVSVTAGATASSTVTYSTVPSSGQLWVPTSGLVTGYSEANLLDDGGTGAASATLIVRIADGGVINGPEAIAFDRSGTAWVTNGQEGNVGPDTIMAFTSQQLADGGDVRPAIVLTSADAGNGYRTLDYPTFLAFDSSGNLWVSNYGGGSVVEFSASALQASGAPSVTQIIPGFVNTGSIAFDANGNLWVFDGSAKLQEFPKAQLSAANPTATVAIPNSTAFSTAWGSAFDTQGTLWAAECESPTFKGVAGYTAAELVDGGANDPALQLTYAGVNCPVGVAFDNEGNLWVEDTGASRLVAFTPAQLSAAGTQVPFNEIPIAGSVYFGQPAFYPTPVGSPLNQ